jgi:hypothetical protein
MSFDDLVITGMKTAGGERFLIGARARGELVDHDSIGISHLPFPPPMDGAVRKALDAAGIRPYMLMPESVLRAGLGELGLAEQDINRRFEAARKLISTVTEYQLRDDSH